MSADGLNKTGQRWVATDWTELDGEALVTQITSQLWPEVHLSMHNMEGPSSSTAVKQEEDPEAAVDKLNWTVGFMAHNLVSTAWIHGLNLPYVNSQEWWRCNDGISVSLLNLGPYNTNFTSLLCHVFNSWSWKQDVCNPPPYWTQCGRVVPDFPSWTWRTPSLSNQVKQLRRQWRTVCSLICNNLVELWDKKKRYVGKLSEDVSQHIFYLYWYCTHIL